ncbi:MAG: methyltransferase domain-containing protein [Candidatus Omnitrophica bacterium]|nr:methyltransferase domain-containing protein [Candidatus Omnitrophota bacterium]
MPDIKIKPPGYHNIVRQDILDKIPPHARKVLDLGCGSGALGAALKKRQECEVRGLEMNPAAYAQAGRNLDICLCGNLDKFDPDKFPGLYDVIIFGDILEHVIDPWNALRRYSEKLKKDGIIVASIPNAAHPAVLYDLSRGLFRYRSAGLLDVTHLRFFTLPTIGQMFIKAGLKIFDIEPRPNPNHHYQYIISARPLKTKFDKFTTTIIMPVRNALDYTRIAVQSIREHTQCPYKLIIINDGSDAETTAWINDQTDVLSLQNIHSLGFPTACNLGLECVDTPFCMIINSDVKVTPGWLCKMLATMSANENIGILGPMTNRASGPQVDTGINYRNDQELNAYAKKLEMGYRPRLKTFERIVFFCALIRSELISKIGLLDESFGLGNFEDDDYCIRSIKAGYKNVIDQGVFVHHYGSQTFKTQNLDYVKIMKTAEARFRAKWGL